MTITTNLNMLLGGVQIAQIPGQQAVEVLNLIYDHRQLAYTEQAFQHLSGMRPLAQALNMHLTPNAPRMKAPGEQTAILLTPNIALSAFHIVSEHLNLLQAELRFVSATLATGGSLLSHDEKPDEEEDEDEGEGFTLDQVVAMEIREQLTDDQIHQLEGHFSGEDDELEDFTDVTLLIKTHGIDAVVAQIKAFGFEFTGDLLDGEEDFEEEDEFEDDVLPVLPEYVLTVMRQDLIALGESAAIDLARSMGHKIDRTYEQLIEGLMADPIDLSDECASLGYRLPNFAAVAGALDEDDDRDDRLTLLELHDLEMLCEALRIDHDELSSEEMIDALCERPATEFMAALHMANVTLPDIDEDEDLEDIDAHRETFALIASLTMLQSALAACIAQAGDAGGQDLILSFTN